MESLTCYECGAHGTPTTMFIAGTEDDPNDGVSYEPACAEHRQHEWRHISDGPEGVPDETPWADRFDEPDPTDEDFAAFAADLVNTAEVEVQLDDLAPCGRCIDYPATHVDPACSERCEGCEKEAADLAARAIWERGDAEWALDADDPTRMHLRLLQVLTNNDDETKDGAA